MLRKRFDPHYGMVIYEEIVLPDRISGLPDELIVLILSRLPTVAAIRTSLLSKRWRRMWTLVPALDFTMSTYNTYFRSNDKQITFMDKCLSYPSWGATLSKLKIQTENRGDCGRVVDWLRLPILESVKELEFVFNCSYKPLPPLVLDFGGLSVLRLRRVGLKTTNTPVSLPSLRELHLEHVDLDNRTLNDMLSRLTSLESLELHYCDGFLNLEFSSSSLKYLVLSPQGRRTSHVCKVEAGNLQSFKFMGDTDFTYSVDLTQCPAIRNILISKARLNDQWLENHVTEFKSLESLKLSKCRGLSHLKICNQNLKSLTFETDRFQLETKEATIIAPSLEYFHYIGMLMLGIYVKAPNLVNADIRILFRKSFGTEWYVSLLNFLSEFNGLKTARMYFPSKMALIVPEEVRNLYNPPLPDLKYLKVKTVSSELHMKSLFVNSMFWMAPSLKTLSVVHTPDVVPRRSSGLLGCGRNYCY